MTSKIGWTQKTWNPVTGCTKISDGCRNCYAEKMAKRLKAMGQPNYVNGFEVTMHPHALEIPLHWRKPREVFVCSMGDLFHKDVPFGYVDQVYASAMQAWWNLYQILTKRTARLAMYMKHRRLPENVWLGASIENQRVANERLPDLLNIATARVYVSMEPLLGPVDLAVDIGHGVGDHGLDRLSGVIVGGESGPNARPMHLDWVRSIRDQCLEAGVPFFMKQMSGRRRSVRQYRRT